MRVGYRGISYVSFNLIFEIANMYDKKYDTYFG